MTKYFFTSKGCVNCQLVDKPSLLELGVEEVSTDTLEGMTFAMSKGIMALPSFVNGDEVLVGAKPREELIKFFNG